MNKQATLNALRLKLLHKAKALETAVNLDHDPSMTVVLICFNYGRYLHEALKCLRRQTLSGLEIILVEGGSTQIDTLETVLDTDLSGIRLVVQNRPTHIGANRNAGISAARGEYICCLDCDDLLAPTYLEKALYIAKVRGYDIVSCSQQNFDEDTSRITIMEAPTHRDVVEGNHILTAAIFRRSLWQQIGGYRDYKSEHPDKDIHVHEDWDFWIRMTAAGAKVHNMRDEYLFHYRVHSGSLSRGANVANLQKQKERLRAWNKNIFERMGSNDPTPAFENLKRSSLINTLNPAAYTKPVIALAVPYLNIGGAEKLLLKLCQDLHDAGFQCLIIGTAPEHKSLVDQTPAFENITSDIFHMPRFLQSHEWFDFIGSLLMSRNPELLLIVGSAFCYRQLPWIRSILPSLRVWDMQFNPVGHMKTACINKHLLDGTFVDSLAMIDMLVDQGWQRDKISQLNSGVDTDIYKPDPTASSLLKTKLGLARDSIIVGFCGRWSDEKDPLGYVQIAKKTHAMVGEKIAFVMTGAGPLEDKIKEELSIVDFPDGIFRLLGQVDDISPIMAGLDILCLPSKADGRPFVMMEAMAYGVPVLASRLGAMAQFIRHGENGWLCAPEDYDAFCNILTCVVVEKQVSEKITLAARKTAIHKFSSSTLFENFKKAIGSLS